MSTAPITSSSSRKQPVVASVVESQPAEGILSLVPIFTAGMTGAGLPSSFAKNSAAQSTSPVTSQAFSSPADSRQTQSPLNHDLEAKVVTSATALPVKPMLAFVPHDFEDMEPVGVTYNNRPVYRFKPRPGVHPLRKRPEDLKGRHWRGVRNTLGMPTTVRSDRNGIVQRLPKCSIYECLFCKQTYGRKYTAMKHVEVVHRVKARNEHVSLISRLSCPYCDTSLANKDSLKVHLRNRHGFSCEGAVDLVEDLYARNLLLSGNDGIRSDADAPMPSTGAQTSSSSAELLASIPVDRPTQQRTVLEHLPRLETKLQPRSSAMESDEQTRPVSMEPVNPVTGVALPLMYNPFSPLIAPRVVMLNHGHYMVQDNDCQFEVFHDNYGVPSVRTHFYRAKSSDQFAQIMQTTVADLPMTSESTQPMTSGSTIQVGVSTTQAASTQATAALTTTAASSATVKDKSDAAVDGLLLLLKSKPPTQGDLTDSD